jgi:hypothetical protein
MQADQLITLKNVDGFFQNNVFRLSDKALTMEETDVLAEFLETNKNCIKEISWINVSMNDIDFFDVLQILEDFQRNISSITIKNFPFHSNSLFLDKFRKFILSSKNIQSLDLSNNLFSTIDYGILLNTCEKNEQPIVLNLSGCNFNEETQENIKSFLLKAHNIQDIILMNTNINNEALTNISNIFRRGSEIALTIPFDQSTVPQPANTPNDPRKPKVNMDYSTVDKRASIPKFLIKCECQRKLQPSDMFNCNTCCRSVCTFCTKNTIYCYSCVSCAKSNVPASLMNARLRNSCASCLECPMCMNTLFTHDSKNSNDPSSAFFICKFCFWNSKNFGIARETSDDLVKANFDITLFLMKSYENFLTNLYDSQKAIVQSKSKNPLLNYMEMDFAKKNGLRVNVSKAENAEAAKKDVGKYYFSLNLPNWIIKVNPFVNSLDDKFETEPDNPLYVKFYGDKENNLSRLEFIDRFKPNEFNLKLYQNFPLKLYRSKNDYMIPKKKLQIYLSKNCKTCLKSLVNYEIQSDVVIPKHTSFYLETNPIYQMKEIRLIQDDGAKTYRLFMNISNYSAYKFHLLLVCKNNCKFSNKEEQIEHEFDFNRDIFNISSLKADSNTINNNVGKSIEIDFVVDPSDTSICFSLTQTKTLVLQNRSVITDELIIDFGALEKFNSLFTKS